MSGIRAGSLPEQWDEVREIPASSRTMTVLVYLSVADS